MLINSTFFADMQGTNLTATTEVVDVDVNDGVLKPMLLSVNFNEPWTNDLPLSTSRLSTLVPLLNFLLTFGFDKARDKVEREVFLRANHDPWELFIEASIHDYLDVATRAVGRLDTGRLTSVRFWPNISGLRIEWQSAFIFAVFDTQAKPTPISNKKSSNSPYRSNYATSHSSSTGQHHDQEHFAQWNCKYHLAKLATRFEANVRALKSGNKLTA